jgi:hypothetical protein
MTEVRRYWLVAGLICLTLAACSTDEGRGVNVNILNGFDEVVVVTYEEPGHEMDVATIDPAGATEFSRVFSELGPSCHGPFVARTVGGQEIARAGELCPGVVWTITAPNKSASP